MHRHMNMSMEQLNLSLLSTPYYENGTQFNDLDQYPFDDTIEGATLDNYLYCPSVSFENISYQNVSCDAALNFSVPLYGKLLLG